MLSGPEKTTLPFGVQLSRGGTPLGTRKQPLWGDMESGVTQGLAEPCIDSWLLARAGVISMYLISTESGSGFLAAAASPGYMGWAGCFLPLSGLGERG